jgi:hypothetical protein
MIQLFLNNTLIDNADVKKWPDILLESSYDDNLIADSISITLNNINQEYDDRVSGSLFYGADYIGWPVDVYDSEKNIYLWRGKLRLLEKNDNQEAIITTTNYKQSLANITCVYDSSAANETPAESIYNLLTDPDQGNISPDDIIFEGFQNAIVIQQANNAYAVVVYTIDDNVNILTVISELCRISQCGLYEINNHIGLYQWEQYSGEIGIEITAADIIAKSYKDIDDDEIIYNDYSVAYNDSGTATYITSEDTDSQLFFGKRSFLVPNEDVDSTSDNDFKILLKNATGAAWAGDLALTRRKHITKKASFNLNWKFNFLGVFDLLRLNFDPFINEPFMVDRLNFNLEKQIIEVEGWFVNFPYEFYSRDVAPPEIPALISVIPLGDGGITIKWSRVMDADLLGYQLYFASTLGEWGGEQCNIGISPIDIKNPSQATDGNYYITLYQLASGSKYYFKIRSYDTSFNVSDFSEVKSCYAYLSDDLNKYFCTGDIVNKISLDRLNASAGANLTGTTTVFPATLSAVLDFAAAWESGIIYNADGFTSLTYFSFGKLYFQYREYSSGSFGSWKAAEELSSGPGTVYFNGEQYLQFRFLFASKYWSDADYFYIKAVA